MSYEHENAECEICGEENSAVLFEFEEYGEKCRNVICKKCGLVYLNPRFSKESYKNYYQKDFLSKRHGVKNSEDAEQRFLKKTKDSLPRYQKMVLNFKEFLKPEMNVLDIGCGYGYLMQAARESAPGIKIKGVEIAENSRHIAEERLGFDVFAGDFDAFLVSNSEKFDFIILNHVFEHFADPGVKLKQLANILAENGLVYFGLPNLLDPREPYDRFFQLPHPFSYSPGAARKILEKNGFKIVKFIGRCSTEGMAVVAAKKESLHPETREMKKENVGWEEVNELIKSNLNKYHLYRQCKKGVLLMLPAKTRQKISQSIFNIFRFLNLS